MGRDLVGCLVVRVDPELARAPLRGRSRPRWRCRRARRGHRDRSTRCPRRRPRSARPRRSRRRAVHLGLRREVPGLAGRRRAPFVGPETPRLLGRVRPGKFPVSAPHLFGVPLRNGVIGKGVAVLVGHVVGRMRIPKMDVEEPRVRASPPLEPVEHSREHLVGSLGAESPDQVHRLQESRCPPRRAVAQGKARKRGGVVAGAHESRREGLDT